MAQATWQFIAIIAVLAAVLFGVQAWTGYRLKLYFRPGDPLFLPSDDSTRQLHRVACGIFIVGAAIAFGLSILTRS